MGGNNEYIFGEGFQVKLFWGWNRSYPRYPLRTPLTFSLEPEMNGSPERTESRDITLGGMGVAAPPEATTVPPVGCSIRLEVSVPQMEDALELDGVVVHSTPGACFGVSFQELDSERRVKLKRLLTSLV